MKDLMTENFEELKNFETYQKEKKKRNSTVINRLTDLKFIDKHKLKLFIFIGITFILGVIYFWIWMFRIFKFSVDLIGYGYTLLIPALILFIMFYENIFKKKKK